MLLPLYSTNEQHPSASDLKTPNGGLWFEKFFRDYDTEFSKTLTNKRMFDELAGNQSKKFILDKKNLKLKTDRQKQLVNKLGGVYAIYATTSSFVTGMGQNHPIENGFAWHPTLSSPFIAGSAVKGLLRHWMKHYRQEAYSQISEYWFGNEQSDANNQTVGHLIFFDAITADDNISLIAEIMTPHFGKWYNEGDKGNKTDAPHDSHTPVPIKFLAVKNASFIFAIAPRDNQDKNQAEHAKLALKELGFALQYLGAGAKTSTGFGRMKIDEKAQKAIEHEQQQASTSELSKTAKKLTKSFIEQGGQPNADSGNDIFNFITALNIEALSAEEVSDVRMLMKTYKPSKKKDADFKQRRNAFNARYPE